jgi:hypothetical protein
MSHTLDYMIALPRWLLWKAVPDPAKPKKPRKIPISAATGQACDPIDPANHVDYASAYAAQGPQGATGMAFVFVKEDGLFFVDIDDCLDASQPGGWSPIAQDLMQRFAGCAIEVSQSGKGLHIFGRYDGNAPDHSCKNIPLGLELYTENRFCAVTFDRAVGDASTVATVALEQAVADYFTKTARDSDVSGWTDEPRDGYDTSLSDDDHLIERATKTSANRPESQFGGISFGDLFTGNADAIARKFPGSSDGGYDASSADSALASHLLFWTGHNYARIERLMRRSALARDKWDFRDDYLERTILNAAKAHSGDYARPKETTSISEGPQPLRREMPPAPPYPLDALGPILEPAARAIIDRVQVPDAIAAQSVLAVASLAAQAHADVALPPNGKTSPLSLFLCTVAASGERKSAADKDALIPVVKRQAALRDQEAAEKIKYEIKLAAYETAHKAVLRAEKDSSRDEIEAALAALGSPPQPPLSSILLMREPTLEGLHKLFEIGQPSLGLFSDEAGLFVGGNAMNKDNRLKTAAGLSELWDGAGINRIRAGDGASALYGRRLAKHLMMQPDVAAMMLADPMLKGQGLLSRMLVAAPNSIVGTRMQRPTRPDSLTALNAYADALYRILATDPPLKERTRNELHPRLLKLSEEASALWRHFADDTESKAGPGGQYEPVVGFANKLPEHATRIAAVLEIIGNVNAEDVTAQSMERGVRLARFYISEALRLFDAGMVSPDILSAEKLLAWLHERGDHIIGLTQIYQTGPNMLRQAAQARAAAKILAEHGWLIPIKGGALINGKHVNEAWNVVLKNI